MPYKALLWIITRAPGVFRARKYLRSPTQIQGTAQAISQGELPDLHDDLRAMGLRPCLCEEVDSVGDVVEVWVRDDGKPPATSHAPPTTGAISRDERAITAVHE